MLSLFEEFDEDKNGKLAKSELNKLIINLDVGIDEDTRKIVIQQIFDEIGAE